MKGTIKIYKVRMALRPRVGGRRETRYPEIKMQGRHLSEKGYESGGYFYVKEHADGSMTISPHPFYEKPVEIGSLEDLKQQFKKLNIPVTRSNHEGHR